MEEALKPHIVICHGLNNRAEVMNDLEQFFSHLGFVCIKMTLKGHGKQIERVSSKHWINDIVSAYQQIPEDAPKFFCGFSIGCLAHHAASRQHNLNWSFSWYFSPALYLRWPVYLLKIPAIFPELKLPSFAHKDYRAHRWLPCRYYRGLFDLNRQVDMSQQSNIHILMSPKDEVISYKKTSLNLPDQLKFTNIRLTKMNTKDSYHLTVPYKILVKKDIEMLESSIRDDLKKITS